MAGDMKLSGGREDQNASPVVKPIIVFVPGAGHTPTIYDLVMAQLHTSQYRTTSVCLPSVGVSPGLEDFSADVAAVRATVLGLAELGLDVVVVCHSYGGVPCTEAMNGLGKKDRDSQGLPGGVVWLIYVAAIIPIKGTSAMDAVMHDADATELKRIDNNVRAALQQRSISSRADPYRTVPRLSKTRLMCSTTTLSLLKPASMQVCFGRSQWGKSPWTQVLDAHSCN